MESFSYFIAMAGTVAFAVTAVLAVSKRGIDLFGACVLGITTAIGGGTIRDLILDVPVFWSTDLNYIWVGLVSSLATFIALPFFKRRFIYLLLLYIDGFGASLFAIQAMDKVWELQFGLPVAPILLGITTAIGGGVTRDILAGQKNPHNVEGALRNTCSLWLHSILNSISHFSRTQSDLGFCMHCDNFWNTLCSYSLETISSKLADDANCRRC